MNGVDYGAGSVWIARDVPPVSLDLSELQILPRGTVLQFSLQRPDGAAVDVRATKLHDGDTWRLHRARVPSVYLAGAPAVQCDFKPDRKAVSDHA